LEEAWIEGLPPFGVSSEYAETRAIDPTERRPTVTTPSPEEAIVPSASFKEAIPLQVAKPRVTVETAVEAYMADARGRELRSSTISKLETTFRRQFLSWTKAKGLDYLDEIDLDSLLTFRTTWKDEGMSKQKKQERLIGFFREYTKRSYISQNPAVGMRKIKFVQIPTDYFTCEEFDRIIAATYICGDDNGYRVDKNQLE
jgi:integrase/recombinase XerD